MVILILTFCILPSHFLDISLKFISNKRKLQVASQLRRNLGKIVQCIIHLTPGVASSILWSTRGKTKV